MPDILRILPTGGTYKEFKSTVPSGATHAIGDIELVQDTYAVALRASEAAERTAEAAAMAAGLTTGFGGGGIVGTNFAAGTVMVYIYEAEKIMLPKTVATGEAFVVGDDVYLDPNTLLVTPNINTGVTLWVGTCQKAAGDNDTRVLCSFEGTVNGNN